MTNLQKTKKIWEDTMGRKMDTDLECYLHSRRKSYQTVETLNRLTKQSLSNYLSDTSINSYYATFELDSNGRKMSTAERIDRDAEKLYSSIQDFKAKYTK